MARDPNGYHLFDGVLLTVASVYCPNSRQVPFLAEVFSKLVSFLEGELVIGGDFNMVADLEMDRLTSAARGSSLQSVRFKELMEELGIVDVWREKHPIEREYTFYPAPHGS